MQTIPQQASKPRSSAGIVAGEPRGSLGSRASRPILFPQFEEEYCSLPYLADVLRHRFSISGETFDLGESIDWLANPSKDIEWHIVLHKFYFAPGLAREFVQTGNKEYLEALVSLIHGWITATPVGHIAADVTARRAQNWIYALHVLRREGLGCPQPFEQLLIESLREHIEFVMDNIAPARNHRTLALYSIFVASVQLAELFDAKRWRDFAINEMAQNICADILPDGVHCELSTDYHHIVLKNYLLFVRIAQANSIEIPNEIFPVLQRALEFALYIHRPDGNIPALSDSDSRSYLELLDWGAKIFLRPDFEFAATRGRRGIPPADSTRVFADSGYAVLRSGWKDPAYGDARYLVFDAGPVGAGNHGHLDALSVEAYAFGRPLIVDPGRYTYDEADAENWRSCFRCTGAHNTVTVDGLEQARYEQKGKQKKILQPHPDVTLRADLEQSSPALSGTCKSANYDAVHSRQIVFPDGRFWWVVDILDATDLHEYEIGYQLSSEAWGEVETVKHARAIEFRAPGLQLALIGVSDDWEICESFVSTSYGRKECAPRIVGRRRSSATAFLTLILPYRDQPLPLSFGASGPSLACSIELESGLQQWLWDPIGKQIKHLTAVRGREVPASATTMPGRSEIPDAERKPSISNA